MILSLRESPSEHDDLRPLIFTSTENLLLYVTENWEDNFVTCDIDNEEILASYRFVAVRVTSFQI